MYDDPHVKDDPECPCVRCDIARLSRQLLEVTRLLAATQERIGQATGILESLVASRYDHQVELARLGGHATGIIERVERLELRLQSKGVLRQFVCMNHDHTWPEGPHRELPRCTVCSYRADSMQAGVPMVAWHD